MNVFLAFVSVLLLASHGDATNRLYTPYQPPDVDTGRDWLTNRTLLQNSFNLTSAELDVRGLWGSCGIADNQETLCVVFAPTAAIKIKNLTMIVPGQTRDNNVTFTTYVYPLSGDPTPVVSYLAKKTGGPGGVPFVQIAATVSSPGLAVGAGDLVIVQAALAGGRYDGNFAPQAAVSGWYSWDGITSMPMPTNIGI